MAIITIQNISHELKDKFIIKAKPLGGASHVLRELLIKFINEEVEITAKGNGLDKLIRDLKKEEIKTANLKKQADWNLQQKLNSKKTKAEIARLEKIILLMEKSDGLYNPDEAINKLNYVKIHGV